jgi:hypothetical protein
VQKALVGIYLRPRVPPPPHYPPIPGQPAAASPTAPRSWAGQEAGTATGWAGATWPGRLHARTGAAYSRRVGFLSLRPGHPELLSPHFVHVSFGSLPCLPPPFRLFPSWVCLELRNAVSRPSRDSKRSFVFPRGQQPNASLVFRNKADIQSGGDRLTFSPPQSTPPPCRFRKLASGPRWPWGWSGSSCSPDSAI